MSLGISAAGWAAISAVVAVGTTAYASDQARTSSNKARDASMAAAKKTAQQQDEADNRANQKQANTQSLLEAAVNGNKGGAASTLLTGSTGIDPNSLTLGKNSLLGG